MTRKEFINEAMDIAKIALEQNNHEAYRRCMEIIADAIYEMHAEKLEIVEEV